jgi:DUF1680 family protein
VQGVADYVLNIYFHDDNALYVNLFTPSIVSWKRPSGTIVVEQMTNYPSEDASRIIIRAGGKFALKVRIPAWTSGATFRVNSRAANPAKAGDYVGIERNWKPGDTVDVVVPQLLRTLPIDESHPDIVALLRGAVLYVGLNPWEGIEQMPVALPKALKPLKGRSDSYVMSVQDKDLVFVPYFEVQLESYNTYFRKALPLR